MKKKTTLYLVQAALIAAMYVALTYLSNMAGLWEVRFSEALCILPYFTGAAARPDRWLRAGQYPDGLPAVGCCFWLPGYADRRIYCQASA